ncbi:hypothetical protein H311_04294 [Anncaliia algerae PRA109]|nr:hypothetical protein H311_04294 [Anncaliia algerae PRA109]
MGNKTEVLMCSNCSTKDTPLWRRGPDNSYHCNACGLYYRIHNKNRPKEYCIASGKKRMRTKKQEEDSTYQLNSSYSEMLEQNQIFKPNIIRPNFKENKPQTKFQEDLLNLKNRSLQFSFTLNHEELKRLKTPFLRNERKFDLYPNGYMKCITGVKDQNTKEENRVKDTKKIESYPNIEYFTRRIYAHNNLSPEELEAAYTLVEMSKGIHK